MDIGEGKKKRVRKVTHPKVPNSPADLPKTKPAPSRAPAKAPQAPELVKIPAGV